MEAERVEKFRKVVQQCGDTIAILIAQGDPDAYGTAALLRKIIEHLGKSVIVYYAGIVSQLNRAMFNLFNLERDFDRLPSQLPPHFSIALVDSSMFDDKRFGTIGIIAPKIVIDHHRGEKIPEAEDVWIEIREVGSACSLAADLAFTLGVALDENTATLGALGIANDTDSFEAKETTTLDRKMFAALMEHGKQSDFMEARKYPLPARYYEIWKSVLDTQRYQQGTLIASAGFITEREKDFVARIANNLMRWEGVELLIVWAVVDDKKFVVKARTHSVNKPLSEILKRVFGQNNAGAKTWAGGAEVPLAEIAPVALGTTETSRQHFLRILIEIMCYKFDNE